MDKQFAGIIFDMDGVLVFSEDLYKKRRDAYLATMGISVAHLAEKSMVGGSSSDIWGSLCVERGIPLQVAKENYDHYKKAHPIPFAQVLNPDAYEVLVALKQKGIKIGLASSSIMADIKLMLKECQLADFFDAVYSGREFPETKPHPAVYLHALAKLQLTSSVCLAIEDSEKGILAANRAGLTVLALEDKHYGMDQSQAHQKITSLKEILTYF